MVNVIKFRNRELKKHRISKPNISWSYYDSFCTPRPLENIHVKATIIRDGIEETHDFVLDECQHQALIELTGVFVTTTDNGDAYLFRFLPSDKLIILEDGFDAMQETERERTEKKRQQYMDSYEKKLAKWTAEDDEIRSRPFIYWEGKK